MPKTVVLASGNKGKITELSSMLAPFSLKVVSQSEFDVPEVAETGTTFVENAIIKARHAAKITGLPAIADDSGLAVNVLDGAPGVYSARFAGANASDQDNIEKLLHDLTHVPAKKRQARFLCVLVYMRHADDPTPIICQGEWRGMIAETVIGSNGFGYDPIFWLPDLQSSSAQLNREQKNAISHRGKALKMLTGKLITELGQELGTELD